jgi:hypothetical protein
LTSLGAIFWLENELPIHRSSPETRRNRTIKSFVRTTCCFTLIWISFDLPARLSDRVASES